jgi:hypothetical protein
MLELQMLSQTRMMMRRRRRRRRRRRGCSTVTSLSRKQCPRATRAMAAGRGALRRPGLVAGPAAAARSAPAAAAGLTIP